MAPSPISENFIHGLVLKDNSTGEARPALADTTTGRLLVDAEVTISGGATEAKQDTIIGHVDGLEGLLTTIDTDTGDISTNLGAIADASSSVGGTGSLSAKLRRITSQLNDLVTISNNIASIVTSTQLIDDTIFTDDGAFTVGSSKVSANGYLVDETATDSADEGDIGAARMTADRKQISAIYAHTTGGYTPGKLISAATTNATNVKNAAGKIGYITASNVNASARYLKIYNTSASPTVGTDTPVHVFLIPGNTAGAGTNIPLPPQGINLGTGISFAITTGVADSDTGAVAANEIVVNYGWI